MLLYEKPLTIGVDIGGSHITAALIDLEKQCVLDDFKIRAGVNSYGTSDEILDVWINALKSIISKCPDKISHLRLAMPGPFDYKNGISLIKGMNKYESLYGFDVRSHLSRHLDLAPECILFRNDAEAFLHGEVFCGAARSQGKAIGITLGTGLGSAISINGITKDACLGVSDFKDGIAEDYISTRWFVKRYYELTGKSIKDTEALVKLHGAEPAVGVIVDEFCASLSLFLQTFIEREQPDVVVIGGNIARYHALFLVKVKRQLEQNSINTPLKITELWEDGALLGAAYYSASEKAVAAK